MIRRCPVFLPLGPSLKLEKEISNVIALYTYRIFKAKGNLLCLLNFLKHKAVRLGWTHTQQNINHLKLLFMSGIII